MLRTYDKLSQFHDGKVLGASEPASADQRGDGLIVTRFIGTTIIAELLTWI